MNARISQSHMERAISSLCERKGSSLKTIRKYLASQLPARQVPTQRQLALLLKRASSSARKSGVNDVDISSSSHPLTFPFTEPPPLEAHRFKLDFRSLMEKVADIWYGRKRKSPSTTKGNRTCRRGRKAKRGRKKKSKKKRKGRRRRRRRRRGKKGRKKRKSRKRGRGRGRGRRSRGRGRKVGGDGERCQALRLFLRAGERSAKRRLQRRRVKRCR